MSESELLTPTSRKACQDIATYLETGKYTTDEHGNRKYEDEDLVRLVGTICKEQGLRGQFTIHRFTVGMRVVNRNLTMVPLRIVEGTPTITPHPNTNPNQNSVQIEMGKLLHIGDAEAVLLTPVLDVLLIVKPERAK